MHKLKKHSIFAATIPTTLLVRKASAPGWDFVFLYALHQTGHPIVGADFRLPQHIVLESWLESLTSLRNFIEHHARIWNRRFPKKPELLRRSRYPWITNRPQQPFKLFPILCCITYWLNAIDTRNTFAADFKALLVKYPNIEVRLMGFPAGWRDEALWKWDSLFHNHRGGFEAGGWNQRTFSKRVSCKRVLYVRNPYKLRQMGNTVRHDSIFQNGINWLSIWTIANFAKVERHPANLSISFLAKCSDFRTFASCANSSCSCFPGLLHRISCKKCVFRLHFYTFEV